jgi:hypothetical protein
MLRLANKIIKLTERLRSVFKKSLPAYSCRKSKRTYKQHQLAVIWCLMKYLKTNYRRIVELIELMPGIRKAIGLNQLPHFTTINKFFLRINTSLTYSVLVQTVYLFPNESTMAAIDSTGYSSNYASRHYIQRIHKELEVRNHIKTSISVSTASQCVLAAKKRLGPRNDNIDFPWLAEQSAGLAKLTHMVADKGYDSEANHRLVRQLGSKPMIPVRIRQGGKTYGSYRKKMLRHFDEDIYHQRSLVETVNSVMKRLMGSWVQSRSLVPQCKELYMMCAVYNVHRYGIITLIMDVFYRALMKKRLNTPMGIINGPYPRLTPKVLVLTSRYGLI